MSPSDTSLPAATRVGRVALVVTDLDPMLSFYRDVVGLAVERRDADGATLGAGDQPLLELRRDPDAPERRPDEAGLFHAAFRVPTREALGGALRRIEREWELRGASDHLVSEALYLRDPEGNGIEIYRDRSRDEWPVDDGGRVGMDTLPLDIDELRAIASNADAAPTATDVGHVHLEVTDVPAARSFYVDGLGLGIRQAWGDTALFVAADDYHHHVGLNVWNGRSEPVSGRGLDWFELVVPDRETVDAVRSRLTDRGTAIEPATDGFAVTDPDGITVRVRQ